ncbi:nuclear transcription factor Y subunit B-1 [Lactuca sativa]|uniref:Transcription factor CBF/NF-Y/archaeal histone domain-containing protein n=1 Tax=Lactuca sativa TaxID=4236 RepID=A0A9R1X058_LACSA|nr:nuclear transcription factor Y subunit B-1 [Lactuca sativa]KAJ0195640.1 hypothetical protein LSAT_V11C700347540 [Lactuca sativa]
MQPQSEPTNNIDECLVREQDMFMPIANVIRIMRKSLPPHAKISDDAKETIQECVSEFISFVTSEANDRCQREQRKTITAEDILWAMNKLGFDDYIEPLTIYLHRYRELDGGERGCGSQSFTKTDDVNVDHTANSMSFGNIDAFAPVFRMRDQLFGPATIAGFLNDPTANGGPSRQAASVAGFQPYAQYKE